MFARAKDLNETVNLESSMSSFPTTNMPGRYMFNVELKAGSKQEYTWDSKLLSNLMVKYDPIIDSWAHSLLINQVIVGPSAKENEVNVVHVEVTDPAVKEVVSFPFAYVVQGKQYQQKVDFNFPETMLPGLKIKFTLEGNGPVHLVGYHMTSEVEHDIIQNSDDSDEEAEDEEEEDTMDDDSEDKELAPILTTKRRMETEQNGGSEAKKIKTEEEKNGNAGGEEKKENAAKKEVKSEN